MDEIARDTSLVWTVKELSKVLKLSPNSIRKAIHDGQIFSVRIGRKYLIPRIELERLLSAATEQG